ncbi:MAG: YidC/Oxa1 family membrane protein insertase [Patescibacteria group bacterium]|nr:YidC/Oxa1 family membrane protein insertase [Patescibacteria group bacterium]
MVTLFNNFIYEPILSVLVFIYQNIAFNDLGVSIIILTIVVRIVLFPLFYKGAKDQTIMQRLQPQIKKIQTDHKDNKEKQAQALLGLYKENRLNPFSGFFLLLIQLPVFIALFQLFTKELGTATFASHTLLGLINLGDKNLPITAITAFLQYYQGKLSFPKQNEGEKSQNPMVMTGKAMIWIGPILTLVILSTLPSALGVYWFTSTVFSILQQIYINKKIQKK